MPELCGSTSDSIACTAIAASTALPPRSQHLHPGLGGERIGGDDERLLLGVGAAGLARLARWRGAGPSSDEATRQQEAERTTSPAA